MTDKSKSEEVDNLLKTYSSSGIVITDNQGIPIKLITEELLKERASELVEYLLREARTANNFAIDLAVLKQIVELKKAWWPATQKNVNTNINTFDDELDKWYKARQEIQKSKAILITTESQQEEADDR